MLLGAQAELSLSTAEIVLDDDHGVLVYTDGATDVRGERGAMLGLDGLLELLEPIADMPANGLVTEAERAILAWTEGPIKDDLCILALRPATERA
jgi:serine phosphatase RsbU (regulator of sigma subunit)